MILDELKNSNKVIGSKQVKKAVIKGSVRKVYIASNAEPHIVNPLRELCNEYKVEVEESRSMEVLGNACGIEVGSAAVALLNE